jgi:hypothetical protein
MKAKLLITDFNEKHFSFYKARDFGHDELHVNLDMNLVMHGNFSEYIKKNSKVDKYKLSMAILNGDIDICGRNNMNKP